MTAPTVDETSEAIESAVPEGGRAARRRQQQPVKQSRLTMPVLRVPRKDGDKPKARRSPEQARRARAVGMSLAIVAIMCLGFVLTISGLGALKMQRDQVTAYDDFRYDLANGTAPVGQTDIDGQLLAAGTPVAVLRIPELGLEAVTFEGTTSAVTMSGPGHRRDTVLPGQAGTSVIFGRRAAFGGPFGDVSSLKPGSAIVTQTGQGEATYKVVAVRRAGDVIPPAAKSGRLTLITADGRPYVPDGVLIVDADLETEALPANPRVVTFASLAPAERALQGDPSAWFGLLLWAQGLLIAAILAVVAWVRWARWETWLAFVPVLLALVVATSAQAAQLLPNLM